MMNQGQDFVTGSSAERERRIVLSSFAAATNENGSFGSVRVPRPFRKKYGPELAEQITIKCPEGLSWIAKYDKEGRRIVGLEEFFKKHSVKQWNLIVFEYYGQSMFGVVIYNGTCVSVENLISEAYSCVGKSGNFSVKESEFVVGLDQTELEKAMALFFFNAYYDKSEYYERKIGEYEVFKPRGDLILRNDMYELYKDWKDGETINLLFWSREWEIEIKKTAGFCVFGSVWMEFVEESGLEVGDLLILRTLVKKEDVFACIFKKEYLVNEIHAKASEKVNGSFFQIVQPSMIDTGEVVPPPIATKLFRKQLKKMDTVQCGPQRFPMFYYDETNIIVGFQDILKKYSIIERNSFTFSISQAGEATLRFFGIDGMEVNYEKIPRYWVRLSQHWYLNEIWTEDTILDLDNLSEPEHESSDSNSDGGGEEGGDIEYEIYSFDEVMKPSNVTFTSHGVYIPKELSSYMDHWNHETKLVFRLGEKQWTVGLNMTNGRQRFSAGWNSFIREENLRKGDIVKFMLQNDGLTFRLEIVRKQNIRGS